MDKTVLCEVYEGFDRFFKKKLNLFLGGDALDVAEGIAVDQGHEYTVAIGVDGSWYRELVFVQKLHEKELAYGAESGEVEPVIVCSMLNVLSIFFNTAEGVAS